MKLSILIPVRNEGVNIKIMLKILNAAIDAKHEILVIYDSLDDDTIPAVRSIENAHPNIRLLHNDLGKGVINAVRVGVKAARGEYVLIFAADEVGPVVAIDDMMALLDEGCDLVSCTRYAYGGRRLGGSLIGGALSRLANKLLCVFSGSVFTDATTGIKIFKKEMFDKIRLDSNPIGWAFIFELALKAQHKRLRLGEVPIVSVDRLYGGKSTFLLGSWVKEYLRWFIWGIRYLPIVKKIEKPLVKIPRAFVEL